MVVTDPVCLKRLEEEDIQEQSDYRGQTYYFDSDRCREIFEERPDDFTGKIEQITYGDQGRSDIAE